MFIGGRVSLNSRETETGQRSAKCPSLRRLGFGHEHRLRGEWGAVVRRSCRWFHLSNWWQTRGLPCVVQGQFLSQKLEFAVITLTFSGRCPIRALPSPHRTPPLPPSHTLRQPLGPLVPLSTQHAFSSELPSAALPGSYAAPFANNFRTPDLSPDSGLQARDEREQGQRDPARRKRGGAWPEGFLLMETLTRPRCNYCVRANSGGQVFRTM